MNFIQITRNNKEEIIELLNKKTDGQGFIIDKQKGNKVKCRYTREYINIKDNFSILPGSTIFIKNNDIAFAKYLVNR